MLTEDENGVQGRAQLVRHVRQKFRLVLRRQRELLGLLFERIARLLHLGILALDFGILLGQQPRLGAEFFVPDLEFALPGLQLRRELLRLRKQTLGAHRRFDGIEYDADGRCELIEECEIGLRKWLECGQLDDGFRFALEQHRQHDNTDPLGFPEAGRDRDELAGNVTQQDGLLLERALAGKSLAESKPFDDRTAMSVAGEKLQLPLSIAAVEVIDRALIRFDERT